MNKLTVGDLFAGIGGFSLGLEMTGGFEIEWQVEIDPFCREVLAKHWPHVARHGDIRECGKHNLTPVDLVCGGFPCQPHSLAGKRQASSDERDLWGEFYRIICELRPQWVLAENVSGLLSSETGRFFGRVLGDLAQIGYSTEWFCLRASDFGAPHIRERVFIVAYPQGRENRGIFQPRLQPHFITDCPALANSQSSECQWPRTSRPREPRLANIGADVAHASISGWEECDMPRVTSGPGHITRRDVAYSPACRLEEQQEPSWTYDELDASGERQFESRLGRELNGFSSRLDGSVRWPAGPGEPQHNWEPPRVVIGKQPDRAKRLKALGNAIVPQCVQFVAEQVLASLEKGREAE